MGKLEKFHTIEFPLMWRPDKQVIDNFIKFCNSAGCVAVVDVVRHKAEICILDSRFKHTVHEVEVEDEGAYC